MRETLSDQVPPGCKTLSIGSKRFHFWRNTDKIMKKHPCGEKIDLWWNLTKFNKITILRNGPFLLFRHQSAQTYDHSFRGYLIATAVYITQWGKDCCGWILCRVFWRRRRVKVSWNLDRIAAVVSSCLRSKVPIIASVEFWLSPICIIFCVFFAIFKLLFTISTHPSLILPGVVSCATKYNKCCNEVVFLFLLLQHLSYCRSSFIYNKIQYMESCIVQDI